MVLNKQQLVQTQVQAAVHRVLVQLHLQQQHHLQLHLQQQQHHQTQQLQQQNVNNNVDKQMLKQMKNDVMNVFLLHLRAQGAQGGAQGVTQMDLPQEMTPP